MAVDAAAAVGGQWGLPRKWPASDPTLLWLSRGGEPLKREEGCIVRGWPLAKLPLRDPQHVKAAKPLQTEIFAF